METVKLRVAGFVKESYVDGPGVRFVVFCQGCLHNCKGCQNPQTHSLLGGTLVDIDDIVTMVKSNPMVRGVTISGGDPILQYCEVTELAKRLKSLNYNIWLYTGYEMSYLRSEKYKELLDNIDVVVDGPYKEELKTVDVPFKGSTNQNIIELHKDLKESR